jgi:hypothetical protein
VDRVRKAIGPLLLVAILAGLMFVQNVESHVKPTSRDLAMWAFFSLAYGGLYTGVIFAIFAPLALWLRRRRPPPS